jgi:hypothetical protein
MDSAGQYLCYFCEEGRYCIWINNYYEKFVCNDCDYNFPLKYDNREVGECPICYENKVLLGLPNCTHCMCFQCCKTVYYGTTKKERPRHWNEVECPDWPFTDEDDDEENDKRYEEHSKFEEDNFNTELNTFEELITIRDTLISKRPEWMNTEEFINYENELFRYHKELQKAKKDWEQYNETKIKCHSKCPLCRNPNNSK